MDNIVPEQIKPYLESLSHLTEPPYLYMWTSVIALLLVLYFVRSYRKSRRPIVPFKSEGGAVEIAPHTLRGIIQQSALSVEGVEKAHCRHYVRGRSLKVKVSIHLHASARLKEVENDIKKQIRAILWEQFGMEKVDPIDIKVVKLVGEPNPPRSETKALELDDYEEAINDAEDLSSAEGTQPPRQ